MGSRRRGIAHGHRGTEPCNQSAVAITIAAEVQTKSVENIPWHPNYINAAPKGEDIQQNPNE